MYERYLFLKNMNNHFICIAKNSYRYAHKNLPYKLKIHLLPNAINFSKFNFVGKRDLKQIRLINIGSFVKKKNQSFAVHILKKTHLDCYKKTYSLFHLYLIHQHKLFGHCFPKIWELVPQQNHLLLWFLMIGSLLKLNIFYRNMTFQYFLMILPTIC